MKKKALIASVIIFGIVAFALILLSKPWNPTPKTLKIGAVLPLSGDIASYGVRVKQGAEIAIQELKAKGLPSLEIEFQDDQNVAKNAVSIMETFCSVKKYPVVIGAAGSSVSLAIAPIANKNKVVQISPLSSSEQLTKDGGDYFFRVCPADDQQAKILAAWVAAKQYDKIGVIYTNNSWGLGLANAFKSYYSHGPQREIVIFEGTAEGQVDFRTVLAKAKAEGIKAIVSPTYPKDGGLLVRQAKELGLTCDFYGADNWGAPEFTEISGTAANGCFFVAQYSYDGPEFKSLNAKFKTLTGKDADVFVAYGYDTVFAIAYALKSAKSSLGTNIRDALRLVKFQGASGLIEFDDNGNLRTEAFVRKVLQDGKPIAFKEEMR